MSLTPLAAPPLGHIGIRGERGAGRADQLTPNQRVSLMTLWAMARSPLMIGGDLPTTSPDVIALFQNPSVLELSQRSTGNRELFREADLVVWGAQLDNRPVAGLFNLGAEPLPLQFDLADAGFSPSQAVREVWSGRLISTQSDQRHRALLTRVLDPHQALPLQAE